MSFHHHRSTHVFEANRINGVGEGSNEGKGEGDLRDDTWANRMLRTSLEMISAEAGDTDRQTPMMHLGHSFPPREARKR